MIKAVIFDFYGVVCADAYTAWQHKYVTDHKERAAQFADISRRSDSGELPLSQFYAELGQIIGVGADVVKEQLGESMVVDEAVMDIAKRLRTQGIKIGLLSNSPTSLYNTLDNFGIRDEFDVILTSEEAGVLKPDPRIYQIIVGKLSTMVAESVFIDDDPVRVAGAVKAGLYGIHFEDPAKLSSELTDLGLQLG